MERKKVMVFGVFDRLHQGHRAFLGQARRHGQELIAVVARDEVVRKLKSRRPREPERARLAKVRRTNVVTRAVLGDKKLGVYGVIARWRPDIICLGYDQSVLADDLKSRMRQGKIARIRMVRLRAYHPDRFRSSLMS